MQSSHLNWLFSGPNPIKIWSVVYVCGKGQRPRNYLSCCSWIYCLINALSTPTTLLLLHFPLTLTPPSPSQSHSSSYVSLYHNISLPLSNLFLCLITSLPNPSLYSQSLPLLPIPKYEYLIATDPGAGIGLIKLWHFSCIMIGYSKNLNQSEWKKINCKIKLQNLYRIGPGFSLWSNNGF